MEDSELRRIKKTNDFRKFKYFTSLGVKLEDIIDTKIDTYRQWLINGRQVRAGSKGLKIYTAGKSKGKLYDWATVFHISQTDPLEEVTKHGRMRVMTAQEYLAVLAIEQAKKG